MKDLKELDEESLRFPPIGPEDADSCRALWLNVLKQYVEDALSVSEKSRMAGIRANARAWLADLNHDGGFTEVCHLAGLDPVKTRIAIKKMLHDPNTNESFRGIPKSCAKTGTGKSKKEPRTLLSKRTHVSSHREKNCLSTDRNQHWAWKQIPSLFPAF